MCCVVCDQEYIDSTRTQSEKNIKLKAYMEAMMKDIKRASHTREEQLTDAVKKYKGVSKTFIKRHEELLVAYRYSPPSSNTLNHLLFSLISRQQSISLEGIQSGLN